VSDISKQPVPRLAVTTSLCDNGGRQQEKALSISAKLSIPCLERENQSIEKLLGRYLLDGVLVVERDRIVYKYSGGEFFFHPGLAILRINEISSGKTDQMIKTMEIRPGDRVLDCTLGLGSDSIVIAYSTNGGEVIGLESSPVISLIVAEGLKSYTGKAGGTLLRSMQNVRVFCADYNDYLKDQAEDSVDVVYFDPMFRRPGRKSCSISALRPLANNSPLSVEALQEATRVARRRVVVKESSQGQEFSRLGIKTVAGGKYSPVTYGIIEKRGG